MDQIDLFRPKWTILVHLVSRMLKSSLESGHFDQNGRFDHFDQNGHFDHLGLFGPAHLPTVPWPLLSMDVWGMEWPFSRV